MVPVEIDETKVHDQGEDEEEEDEGEEKEAEGEVEEEDDDGEEEEEEEEEDVVQQQHVHKIIVKKFGARWIYWSVKIFVEEEVEFCCC